MSSREAPLPPRFYNNATNWEASVQTYEPTRYISRSNHTHIRYGNYVESATSSHYTHLWVIWNNLLSDYPSQKPHCHFLVICSRVYVPALINLSLFLFSLFSFTMLKFENWDFYRLGKCWATERGPQPHPFLKQYWRWFLVLLFPENEIRMKTTLSLSFFLTKHHEIGFWLFGRFWLVYITWTSRKPVCSMMFVSFLK